MIKVVAKKGNFDGPIKWMNEMMKRNYLQKLESYAQKGVEALASATPKDTGKTSESWDYEITEANDSLTITWTNSNVVDYVNIAVILQYGHGTRNGGYVQGIDYINPAIQPIFNEIADAAWMEVTKK